MLDRYGPMGTAGPLRRLSRNHRYHFKQNLPVPELAAPHAGEIEYVFRVLSARSLPWTPADHEAPHWPIYRADAG